MSWPPCGRACGGYPACGGRRWSTRKDQTSVRALHGCHLFDDTCAWLVRHPRLLELAEALLDGPVYVYQFKVNMKSPLVGQRWPWHQDFAFWSVEDGMPAPDAVNIAINLDAVDDRNGPLTVLTGSQAKGLLGEDGEPAGRRGNWRDHVSANLPHTVPDHQVRVLEATFPTDRLTGPAGTVTAFHPNIVHSSSDNLSDHGRTVLFITYNAVGNVPRHATRPKFLVGTDVTPVRPLEEWPD